MEDEIYKNKYLKYKQKYLLAKQSGGGNDALILTKLDTIKILDPQLESTFSELTLNVKCVDFERLMRTNLGDMAHILKRGDQSFRKFTKDVYICGESQMKKMGSEFGNEFGKVANPILTELKRTTGEQLKQASTTMMPQLQQAMQQSIQRGISSTQRKMESKLGQIGTQHGGYNTGIINDMMKRMFGMTMQDTDIAKILDEFKYDVVIKYSPKIIGSSKIDIIKI